MTALVVGCPVRQRAWIIEKWFLHVEHACRLAEIEPVYVVVADPKDETTRLLQYLADLKSRRCVVSSCDEDLSGTDQRNWNHDRFGRMVELRNQLLETVRELAPDRFLSLDSDILLHPQVVTTLLQTADTYDAAGGATYMTSVGLEFPSCGWNRGMDGFIRRPMEQAGVIKVGVIMAIKMMTPAAYAIDYEFNIQGEDIGICSAWQRAGLTIGWDNRHVSKHVMSPADLDKIDPRCGY